MKKLLIILLFTTLSFATTNVVVSIIPQKIFVEKIAGDRATVTVMVEPGASPHNYSPKPSLMRAVTKADLYLSIGVEFEDVWLSKFQNQNREMLLVDSSKGVKKHHLKESEHSLKKQHKQKEESLDPHIWVDPQNVKIIVQNIYHTFVKLDVNNSAFYKKNYEAYLKELDALDLELKEILKTTPKGSTFMVFHPSWGYFAERYALTQLSVEVEGKEPKPKMLINIIKRAKEEKVDAIFTQPEFSDKASQNISRNLNIPVLKASPLAKNWAENLKKLARAIAHKETDKKSK